MISKFTKSVADQIKDTNDCKELLEELEVLKNDFKKWLCQKLGKNLKIEHNFYNF